jgi:hypothetical protein
MTREEAITALKAARAACDAAIQASAAAHRIYEGLIVVCDTAEEVAAKIAYGGYDWVILRGDEATEADEAAHEVNLWAAEEAFRGELNRIRNEYPLLTHLDVATAIGE